MLYSPGKHDHNLAYKGEIFMKKFMAVFYLSWLLLAGAACQNQTVNLPITVDSAWIRAVSSAGNMEHPMDLQTATPEAAGNVTTAAFLKIKNSGDTDDRLLRIEFDLAEVVELHRSEIQNDVMTMRPVEGIDIPAGETIELKPGSYHIMLIGLQREIKPGEEYPLTLVFEIAGSVIVDAEVKAP